MPLSYAPCSLAGALSFAFLLASSVYGDLVVSSSAQQWVSAAQTGRADMLILGDSLVWFDQDGWDAGFTSAAQSQLGLAGTGLLSGQSHGQGEGYYYRGSSSFSPTSHPYQWRQALASSGANAQYGIGLTTALSGSSQLQFDMWVDGGPGGGSTQLLHRLGQAPFSTLDVTPTIAIPETGLPQHITATFAGSSIRSELLTNNANNIDVLYTRVLDPNAAGATVTTWGYGGRSTLDFIQDQYDTMQPDARVQWLNAIVQDGSGLLNIVISEGFNDRVESDPSLGLSPVADGNSPAAFIDNISVLIEKIRTDWVAGGNPLENLSFTLLGMYEVASNNQQLIDFSATMETLALGDEQLSFIDLRLLGPSYEEGLAAGYYADDVHLDRDGALFYSNAVLAILAVPEPSAFLFGGLVCVALATRAWLRHRRSTS